MCFLFISVSVKKITWYLYEHSCFKDFLRLENGSHHLLPVAMEFTFFLSFWSFVINLRLFVHYQLNYKNLNFNL